MKQTTDALVRAPTDLSNFLSCRHLSTLDLRAARGEVERPERYAPVLTVVDEFTRQCLAIEVARKQSSRDVLRILRHGIPKHIRSDNGPEFVAKAVREWLSRLGVEMLFIEPGSPWENGYIESFNGKLRDEPESRWPSGPFEYVSDHVWRAGHFGILQSGTQGELKLRRDHLARAHSDGSSTICAKITARAAANGHRAHHRCSVLGCPCRIDFSRADALLMASSGRATSMSFFMWVTISLPSTGVPGSDHPLR